MKKELLSLLSLILFASLSAQDNTVRAKVVNSSTQKPVENVFAINVDKVKGTRTDKDGFFEIQASPNDNLYFSYPGYKSIKVRVTNDLINLPNTQILLTELSLAFEEPEARKAKLTGYLDVDARNAPISTGYRYRITGLNGGYEAGTGNPGAVNRVLGAIFNPADALYSLFGKNTDQLKGMRKMKQDQSIRDLLVGKYDREALSALLSIDKSEIQQIMLHCNYSDNYVAYANDLQVLDAMSDCYEEYRILNRSN